MLEAAIIYPTKHRKKIISCDDCGIEYAKSEYKALFSNSKIKYFKLTHPEDKTIKFIFCHDCLFDNLKKVLVGEEIIEFAIVSKKYEYICHFYPEDLFLELEGEFNDEGEGMDDFLSSLE